MNRDRTPLQVVLLVAAALVVPGLPAAAQTVSDAELAKDLQNPVADLISVPLESRFDFGPGSTLRYTLSPQPVWPFEISKDWSLVSRTVLPIVYAQSPVPGGSSTSGLGDTLQSFFLAPRNPVDGWILGAGPVLRLPTATTRDLGRGVWGAGPTAVALRQDDAWTYGMLANHVWSFAGRADSSVNQTYLQPFLAYTMESLTTLGLGSETVYDWGDKEWVVPIDATVSQLVHLFGSPVDLALGGRYYATRPEGGPDWSLKFTVSLVFPKKG